MINLLSLPSWFSRGWEEPKHKQMLAPCPTLDHDLHEIYLRNEIAFDKRSHLAMETVVERHGGSYGRNVVLLQSNQIEATRGRQ